jgi:hypothetical protein
MTYRFSVGQNIQSKGVMGKILETKELRGSERQKKNAKGGKVTPRDAKEDKRPDGSGSGRAFSNLLIPV